MHLLPNSGPSSCGDGDVRLVGGVNEREGRVEICYNGVWGIVCADYGWDGKKANIICQQLGFNSSRALPTNNSCFGAGDSLVQLNSVNCTKEHLFWCVEFAFIGANHSCDYTAGVICMDKFMTNTSAERVSTTRFHGTIITDTSHNSISGGSGSSISPIIYGTISSILVIIGIIIAAFATVIILLVIMRKRVWQTENRYNGQTDAYK